MVPGLDAPEFTQSVTTLGGVGPDRAAQLARLDILCVRDLLLHRPRRYEDRRQLRQIISLVLGESVTVRGHVVAHGVKSWQHRRKSLFELVVDDGTGRLYGRWWNQAYLDRQFNVGDDVLLFGRVASLKPRAMDHPETEVLEAGDEPSLHQNRIVPIYPLTEGMSQRWLRALVWRTLDQWSHAILEPPPAAAPPDLPRLTDAIRWLHFPPSLPDAERARQRLAFAEFFELQQEIQRRRLRLRRSGQGLVCRGDNRWMRPFLAGLGFPLTAAQTRVLREIRGDLAGGVPMRRLLQGDVGSGKTVVAAATALMVLESGWSVVLMAPTEILAEQHARTFRGWFEPLGIPTGLRTASHKAEPQDPHALNLPLGAAAPTASVTLTIGTHALLESDFMPDNLGLVVIDEQHKFGVAQREQLVRKGRYPHLLVMTATPIPRTLGLTFYGDLDASVLDALPPGRGPLRTFVRAFDRLPKVWAFVRQQLDQGRQAYVVYPRIEDHDLKTGLKAVTAEWERLRVVLSPHAVGLLHGRLKAEEKDRVMEAFRGGRLGALVSTSVIEVGLDVPNATVMVIENAESYGLAQLHQLRGRIGRGAHEAFCILVAHAQTAEARQRLQVLAETRDGFKIAEADLRLRGPGEFLGQSQSGLPPFRFGDLARDLALIQAARTQAASCVEGRL